VRSPPCTLDDGSSSHRLFGLACVLVGLARAFGRSIGCIGLVLGAGGATAFLGSLGDLSSWVVTSAPGTLNDSRGKPWGILELVGTIGGSIGCLGLVLGAGGATALLGSLGELSSRGDFLGLVLGAGGATTLLGSLGDLSSGILGLVLGASGTPALLGLLRDNLRAVGEKVCELCDELVSAVRRHPERQDIRWDVLNESFDLFHDRGGEKRCVGGSHTQ